MASQSTPPLITTPQINPTLARKLSKVLEVSVETNEDFIKTLRELSTFYDKNSIVNRRNLRGQIEQRMLRSNEEFLSLLSEVQQQLDSVQQSITQMNSSCNEMSERLQQTQRTSGKLIEQAEKLSEQKRLNEAYKDIVLTFLKHFQLTEEEQNVLKHGDINQPFFQVLKRLREIQDNCKILLRTQHQRAGLEIMETMSMHQEAAYRKLFRFVKAECAKFSNPVPEATPLVIQAIGALNDRPVLLSYCLEEISNTRSQTIVKSFHAALTQGGVAGTPRPIELHAHDPLRYLSDMLAWIHQTAASEADFLRSLLKPNLEQSVVDGYQSDSEKSNTNGLESPTHKENHNNNNNSNNNVVGSITTSNQLKSEEMTFDLFGVMDAIFEPVCRPFQMRLDQVLVLKPGALVVFQICQLLDFYVRTMRKIIGEKTLLHALNESKQAAFVIFYEILKEYGDKLQRFPPPISSTLSPAPPVYETVNQLVELLKVFDTSLIPQTERESEIKPVVSALLDPLIQSCLSSASSLSRLDMSVYLINCLQLMSTSIAPFAFAKFRVNALQEVIKTQMDALVHEQCNGILNACGIATKLAMIQKHNPQTEGPLSRITQLDELAMAQAVLSFESTLMDTSSLLMPQCDRLLNSELRNGARMNVIQQVLEAYRTIFDAVHKSENGYVNASTMFSYNPEQLKTILQV